MVNEQIIFDAFRLDVANECVWKGSHALKLRPKALGVLEYLLRHPGHLVSKEELVKAVWGGTFVGEAVLKVAIRQIREALGDDPQTPRFIETAHRRGYRFIGTIGKTSEPDGVTATEDSSSPVVGRDEVLLRMRSLLDKMLRGERQIVFVTGEAGIGKTALVDAFVRTIDSRQQIRVCRGQCLEQYGTSEAYLPVLEAIGRLCRELPHAVNVLRNHAPMWLLQMPSLMTAADHEDLTRQVFGATRERMLREMGDALETLTADVPLALILEDLHWSDYSTLDLISYLARQRQPAKLMLIATYRTVELMVSGHPLNAVKRELVAKQQCEELPLAYLAEEAVSRYLAVRFPSNQFPEALAALIHGRTEGNPLFMVNAVDYLATESLIGQVDGAWQLLVDIGKLELGVPDSIKQMIETQIDHLDQERQRTLETASIAGAEFSTLTLAAALQEDRLLIESQCDDLARRRQFIHGCGVEVLPNREPSGQYGFIHSLFRTVLYERVSPSRRVELHRRIGERLEVLYGARSSEIAAELAMHFERGGNHARAAKYLQQAADNAIRRFAYRDAVGLARRGLELLSGLPDTPQRDEQELCLQLTLGVPLIATEGYPAPNVGSLYLRARELCEALGETPDISEVLWGLWTFYTLRADFTTAHEIAEEFLRLAKRLPYPGLAMRGHLALQITFMHLGDFVRSIQHFEKALSLYDPERHLEDAFFYAQNPGVAMRCFATWSLWFLGKPDQALQRIEEALTFARELCEPHGLAHAHFFAGILHQLRRDAPAAQQHAEAAIAVSSEHGLALYQAMALITRGWALVEQGHPEEGIEQIHEGLAGHQATGAEVLRAHFLGLLAEALNKTGRTNEAIAVLEDALEEAARTGERYYEGELHRLKNELSAGKADFVRGAR